MADRNDLFDEDGDNYIEEEESEESAPRRIVIATTRNRDRDAPGNLTTSRGNIYNRIAATRPLTLTASLNSSQRNYYISRTEI